MTDNIDLTFISGMLARAIEDLVYRQLEEVERNNGLTEAGIEFIKEMRSTTDYEGNPKEPVSYIRIDKDIKVLANLKETIDKELGIN